MMNDEDIKYPSVEYMNFGEAIVLAAGLIGLPIWKVAPHRQEEFDDGLEQIKKELQEIGLSQEELRRNPARAAMRFLHHPKHTQRIMYTLEELAVLESA